MFAGSNSSYYWTGAGVLVAVGMTHSRGGCLQGVPLMQLMYTVCLHFHPGLQTSLSHCSPLVSLFLLYLSAHKYCGFGHGRSGRQSGNVLWQYWSFVQVSVPHLVRSWVWGLLQTDPKKRERERERKRKLGKNKKYYLLSSFWNHCDLTSGLSWSYRMISNISLRSAVDWQAVRWMDR